MVFARWKMNSNDDKQYLYVIPIFVNISSPVFFFQSNIKYDAIYQDVHDVQLVWGEDLFQILENLFG